jgi:sigma-E factor negative regulatory protein RseB
MRGAVSKPLLRDFRGDVCLGAMSSSRITQACDGGVQIEKVESLTGAPRTVYRRNGEMRTFFGSTRTVRTDRADTLAVFPQPSVVPGAQLSQFTRQAARLRAGGGPDG